MPCPISTLPGNTVTVSLRLIRSQRSRRRLPSRLPGSFRGATVFSELLMRPPLNATLRLASYNFPSRDALDRFEHSMMGSATAQIAFDRGTDLRFAGAWIDIEQCLGSHDDASHAVAALCRLFVKEGLL